jgi:hypothetical protein
VKKNVAGQKIGAQLVSATDGEAFTSAVTIYVTKDAGTQAIGTVGSGVCTHEGNGYHTYSPSQAETDGDLIAFTFIGTGAVPVTVQVAHASEVWDVDYSLHKIAGTFGKLMDILRKSNTVIEGTILASPTPTTTTFKISGADYPTGALEHAVLWMSTGTSAEQNSPILTTVNNGDGTLTITLEEALVTAPIAGDVVLIDPTSHVHAIVDIVSGVWSALTSGLSVVGSTGRALARLIGLVVDDNGDEFTTKALSNAATGGGGGDATEAKQDQIISLIQGSEVLTVASPNVRGNLVLTQGDTYDGATGSNPKATWTVTTDYTSGWSVVLTIRDKDDAVVYTNAGTVPNATTVTVPIVTPTVTPFEGCPGVWQGKYDVQLTKSTSKKTIAIGVVYINEDQTRS